MKQLTIEDKRQQLSHLLKHTEHLSKAQVRESWHKHFNYVRRYN